MHNFFFHNSLTHHHYIKENGHVFLVSKRPQRAQRPRIEAAKDRTVSFGFSFPACHTYKEAFMFFCPQICRKESVCLAAIRLGMKRDNNRFVCVFFLCI